MCEQLSLVTQLCLTLQPHGLQHARLSYPLPTPGACSNLRLSSQWCHPTISSSYVNSMLYMRFAEIQSDFLIVTEKRSSTLKEGGLISLNSGAYLFLRSDCSNNRCCLKQYIESIPCFESRFSLLLIFRAIDNYLFAIISLSSGSLSLSTWFAGFFFSFFLVCAGSLLVHTGSLFVAHRLSCPTACGIVVTWPGGKALFPESKGRFLINTIAPGKFPGLLFGST